MSKPEDSKQERSCGICQSSLAGKRSDALYCSKECTAKAMSLRPPAMVSRQCELCGQSFETRKHGGSRFCGKSCSAKWRVEQPGMKHIMSAAGKKAQVLLASNHPLKRKDVRETIRDRMLNNNPMASEDTRVEVSKRLREMGHKPKERGGKGKGLTTPQKMLAERLGWRTELTVAPTPGIRAAVGTRAKWYSLDVYNETEMIAIEVDGSSHQAKDRQMADAQKDACLERLGWRVLRFSNQAILADLEAVVAEIEQFMTSKLRTTTTTLPNPS